MNPAVYVSPNQLVQVSGNNDQYFDLITSEHKTKPKFMAWVAVPLNIIDDGVTATNSIPSAHDIDIAVGVQLDTAGEIVGVSRVLDFQPGDGSSPVLNDDFFRKVVKARIAKNQWDGTIPGIDDIWNILFPDIDMRVMDNQDMTMTVLIGGQLGVLDTELIANGYVIPKPLGVRLIIMGLTNAAETPYFGALISEADSLTISTNIP